MAITQGNIEQAFLRLPWKLRRWRNQWRKLMPQYYRDREAGKPLQPGEMTIEECREHLKKSCSVAQARLLLPAWDEDHNHARATVGLPPL